MASLTDKFAKSVQKNAVAQKPVSITRPPVPVKQPTLNKSTVIPGKKALSMPPPGNPGQPRATSAVDVLRKARQDSEQNRQALGGTIRGAVGGILGGIGRSAKDAVREEISRWAEQGPVASVSLPFRAVGGAIKGTEKLVRENIIQPAGRGAVTLVGSPLVSLVAPNFEQVPLQPRGPAQQYLLGKEPIQPTGRQLSESQQTAQTLGFTPEASRLLGPAAVIGSAALDVLPDPGDLAKGSVKRGVREAAEGAAERGAREAVESVVENAGKKAIKKIDNKAAKEIGQAELPLGPIRRNLDEVVEAAPTPRVEVARPPARLLDEATPIARTVDEVVPNVVARLPEEIRQIVPKVVKGQKEIPLNFSNDIDRALYELGQNATAEVVQPYLDFVVKNLNIPEGEALRLGRRVVSEVTALSNKSGDQAISIPTVFERTLKSSVPTQPVRPGGKNVIVTPAAMRAAQAGKKAALPPTGNTVTRGSSPLSEARRIVTTEPERPGAKKRLGDFIANVRTSFIQEYFPVRRAEKQLRQARGEAMPQIDTAKRLELQAGAQGKAENDLLSFKEEVVDNISDVAEDFNAYLFLKRTESRLRFDPEFKKVGTWTPEKVAEALQERRRAVGDEVFQRIEATANGPYQEVMDRALRLQVQSGRMTPSAYDAIKASNDFYAPFKVLKYLEQGGDLAGTGRGVATSAQLTKRIQGIKDDDFAVGDFLQQSAQQIYRSRILAEKQTRMRALEELADIDETGQFFRRVPAEKTAPSGREVVKYLSNGKMVGLEMPSDIAQAVSTFAPAQTDLFKKVLGASRTLLRGGATTFNLGFQPVNLLFADLPTTALFSRYGVRRPQDLVRFPLDFVQALGSSLKSNFGTPDQLYRDWLSSGAASSTIQRELTPGAFRGYLDLPPKTARERATRAAKTVLDSVPKLANSIEEAGKLLGFKRALREEGIDLRRLDNLSPAERERELERMIYEVRNYSGSPDFARSGTAKEMNLLFMFFNARVQGLARDSKRLLGRTGGKEAGATWARLSAGVGIPAATLMLYNLQPENYDDYQQIPQWERDNYFMIPRGVTFTDEATGREVREYWRIPKRESVKLFSNLIESAITSFQKKDPQGLKDFAASFLENISPVNIEGDGLIERGQSAIGSLNPLLKVPIEQITNTNLFRKSDLVPQKFASPGDRTLEFAQGTPNAVRGLAEQAAKIFGKDSIFASPLRLQSILEGFTAGGITQFLPRDAEEGRSKLTALPIISRFMRSGTVNEEDFWKAYSEAAAQQQTERRQNTVQLQSDIELLPTLTKEERVQLLTERAAQDPDYLDRMAEEANKKLTGWTSQDTAIQALGVQNGERARFIIYLLREAPDAESRSSLLSDLATKKILTDEVLNQIADQAATEK